MNSGIYKILNKVNGKFYIGSTVNFRKRWYVHLCRLRNNEHDSDHLQAAYNKYGEAAFEFIIVQECSKEDLLKNEQMWLDWTKCFTRETGYNACPTAGNSIGYKHTPEAKAIMIAKRTGIKRSLETRLKQSKAHKGRIVSKETCAKISIAKTGKTRLLPLILNGKPLTKKEDGSWH